MKENPIFFCYSTNLMDAIESNGIHFNIATKHPKTGCDCWVYEKTPMLNQILTDYSKGIGKNY